MKPWAKLKKKVDSEGFLLDPANISDARRTRVFMAIRMSELKALETSGDPVLLTLAARVRNALAAGEERRIKAEENANKLEVIFNDTRRRSS